MTMRFVDMKIRTKLMGAFGILIFISFILSVNSVATLLFFKTDIKSFTGEFLPQLELSSNISTHTQMVAFNMEGYYLTGKSEYYKSAKVELEALKKSIGKGEQLLLGSKNLPQLEQSLSEARIKIPQYEQNMLLSYKINQDILALKEKIEKLSVTSPAIKAKPGQKRNITAVKTSDDHKAALADLSDRNAKFQELWKANTAISEKLIQNSNILRNSTVAYTTEIASGFNKTIAASILSQIILVIISLGFAIYIGFYISRLITRPLLKGIEFARKMAKGDLTAEIDVNQKDKIVLLAYNL